MTFLEAMVALHSGCDRQGPSDDTTTRMLAGRLTDLPAAPRIADLGCGTGASALILAETLGAAVTAVDAVPAFVATLNARAAARGLGDLVRGVVGDMATFRHPDGPLDLLWSEGAAYTLTFPGALAAWHPLLAPGGCAVISELTWFAAPTAEAAAYWAEAYPQLSDEAGNIAAAKARGFDVLFTHRLGPEVWWRSYYDPLRKRADALEAGAPEALRAAIRETRREIALYERSEGTYGYTYYALRRR